MDDLKALSDLIRKVCEREDFAGPVNYGLGTLCEWAAEMGLANEPRFKAVLDAISEGLEPEGLLPKTADDEASQPKPVSE
jgi:hypothetical protein